VLTTEQKRAQSGDGRRQPHPAFLRPMSAGKLRYELSSTVTRYCCEEPGQSGATASHMRQRRQQQAVPRIGWERPPTAIRILLARGGLSGAAPRGHAVKMGAAGEHLRLQRWRTPHPSSASFAIDFVAPQRCAPAPLACAVPSIARRAACTGRCAAAPSWGPAPGALGMGDRPGFWHERHSAGSFWQAFRPLRKTPYRAHA